MLFFAERSSHGSERHERICCNDTNDVRRYVAGGSVVIATCYHALEQDRCTDGTIIRSACSKFQSCGRTEGASLRGNGFECIHNGSRSYAWNFVDEHEILYWGYCTIRLSCKNFLIQKLYQNKIWDQIHFTSKHIQMHLTAGIRPNELTALSQTQN